MKKYRKPLVFSAKMIIPVAVATLLAIRYQLNLYGSEMVASLVEQVGSYFALYTLSILETCILLFVACFFGYIASEKAGLLKPLSFEKEGLEKMGILTCIIGILISLDPVIFGKVLPEVTDSIEASLTPTGMAAGILYGGLVEELLIRWALMSLLAIIIWKVFMRRRDTAPISSVVLANVLSALIFAAGHLPTTIAVFGTLSPIILARCFFYNGISGIAFGWLYRRYGLQYACICHGGAHLVSYIIWLLFI